MSEQVRVGVVGTSGWTDLVHLPGLTSHSRARIAAICGRNRERAEEIAGKYGVASVYTDYRAMIDEADLDACVVATPDDLHHPVTMYAMDAGLHVMCEKPLALTVSQAREMHEKAEAAGVKHMVFFTWRWQPHYIYLKQLVDEGYVGRLYHCVIAWYHGWGRRYMWRFDPRRANGILGDLGSHMIDFARWYGGDIAAVSSHLARFIDRPGPDGQPMDAANDSAILTLAFESGAHGMVHVSGVMPGGPSQVAISLAGDAGTLRGTFGFFKAELLGARLGQQRLETLTVPADACGATPSDAAEFTRLFCDRPIGNRLFIDAILEGFQPSPSFYDGLKAQEVIGAALESHETGRWVSLGSDRPLVSGRGEVH
jgi:predicted dehydrogenase